MRIFVDANILISVLNKEYPSFMWTSRILSLASMRPFEIYTSPICLSIAFYFAGKKSGEKKAKEKLESLTEYIRIAESTVSSVKKAFGNPAILDFEDGLEYYAAVKNQCRFIITEDVDDFYFSDLEVLNSEDFFLRYLTHKKK